MKRVFWSLMCLFLFITVDVKALGLLPAIITANDNSESQSIEFLDGEYELPKFCSITGCIIDININSLMAIGKYAFDSREEYFYISEGGGATIYEMGGAKPSTSEIYENNFNKIVIDATDFLKNGYVTIKLGKADEARTIKLVPNKSATENNNSNEENNQTNPAVVITGSDTIIENSIIDISTPSDGINDSNNPIDETNRFNTPIDAENNSSSNNKSDEISSKPKPRTDSNVVIYILIGLGILAVISSISLLSFRKKRLNMQ